MSNKLLEHHYVANYFRKKNLAIRTMEKSIKNFSFNPYSWGNVFVEMSKLIKYNLNKIKNEKLYLINKASQANCLIKEDHHNFYKILSYKITHESDFDMLYITDRYYTHRYTNSIYPMSEDDELKDIIYEFISLVMRQVANHIKEQNNHSRIKYKTDFQIFKSLEAIDNLKEYLKLYNIDEEFTNYLLNDLLPKYYSTFGNFQQNMQSLIDISLNEEFFDDCKLGKQHYKLTTNAKKILNKLLHTSIENSEKLLDLFLNADYDSNFDKYKNLIKNYLIYNNIVCRKTGCLSLFNSKFLKLNKNVKNKIKFDDLENYILSNVKDHKDNKRSDNTNNLRKTFT